MSSTSIFRQRCALTIVAMLASGCATTSPGRSELTEHEVVMIAEKQATGRGLFVQQSTTRRPRSGSWLVRLQVIGVGVAGHLMVEVDASSRRAVVLQEDVRLEQGIVPDE